MTLRLAGQYRDTACRAGTWGLRASGRGDAPDLLGTLTRQDAFRTTPPASGALIAA